MPAIGFAGDSANIYRYCGNNPANGSDRFGLQGDEETPHKVRDKGDPSVIGNVPWRVDDGPQQIPENGNQTRPGLTETQRGFVVAGPEPFSNPGGAATLFGGPGRVGGNGGGGGKFGMMRRHIRNGDVSHFKNKANAGYTTAFWFIIEIKDSAGNPVGANLPVTEKIAWDRSFDFDPKDTIKDLTKMTRPGGGLEDFVNIPFTSRNGQLTTTQTIFFNGLQASWTYTVYADPEKEVSFQATADFAPTP